MGFRSKRIMRNKILSAFLKNICIAFFFLFFRSYSFVGQSDNVEFDILEKGKKLYYLESSREFSAQFINQKLSTENLIDIIAYFDHDSIKAICLSSSFPNHARYTFTFYPPYEYDDMQIQGNKRLLSKYEKKLVKIKNRITSDLSTDSVFFPKLPEHSFNTIFLKEKKSINVYIIPVSATSEKITLGNDYLYIFSDKGRYRSKSKLHQNYIPIDMNVENNEDLSLSSYHTHSDLSSPYITETDICTLLLYKEVEEWNSHLVISEKYVSFFNIPEKKLLIMLKEEFEKLQKK